MFIYVKDLIRYYQHLIKIYIVSIALDEISLQQLIICKRLFVRITHVLLFIRIQIISFTGAILL